jgi:hypothetical protein
LKAELEVGFELPMGSTTKNIGNQTCKDLNFKQTFKPE